jgi:hypothetical protein
MELFDADGNAYEVEGEPQERMAQLPRNVVRRLEKEAKEGRAALAENEQLKRERAFVTAGIPLSDKRSAYFIAGYNGEQTPEAIRKEWNESFGGSAGTPQSQVVDQELAHLQDAESLISGVGAVSPDLLAQRNAELAALSQSDPMYGQKFDAIFAKYNGKSGSLVG